MMHNIEEEPLSTVVTGDYNSSPPAAPTSFLGISIGCNKGFDAISTLRMGTYDNEINKVDWKKAMTADGEKLHESVCNQDSEDETFIANSNNNTIKKQEQSTTMTMMKKRREGEMHCVEPMPQTFRKLKQAAKDLGYNEKGLVVTHAAVSKESAEMLFHTGGMKSGVENKGLENSCESFSSEQREKECESVPVYSLKDFVQTHIMTKTNQEGRHDDPVPINIFKYRRGGF